MKRIIMIFLTVLAALTLAACGTKAVSGASDAGGKPDDPLELAKQIMETELLGETLENAYQQGGVPRALNWLDLYFMESSDPGPEHYAEVEQQYPTNEELLYGISAAEASEGGWYDDIWLVVHAELCGDY